MWQGKYDPCTTNLRIALVELDAFWNSKSYGEPTTLNMRREYIRGIFGEDDSWVKFCAVAKVFVPGANFDTFASSRAPAASKGNQVAVDVEGPADP